MSSEPAETIRSHSLSTAVEIIRVEVTNVPAPGLAEVPTRQTVITAPWLHPVIHDSVPALSAHLIATYHGDRGAGTWRNGRMRMGGRGGPGTIAVLPAHYWGHWDVEAPAPISYVLIGEARLREIAERDVEYGGRVDLLPRIGEPDKVGARILRFLSRQAAAPQFADNMELEQTLDLLCMHLLRVHSSLDGFRAKGRSGLAPWQVAKVMDYMTERLDRQVSLDELANLLNLSRFHFCTAFRLATGQTPHRWLTARRVERAKELLRHSDALITDIALRVGYQTPSAFAASFRREVGMTPRGFRRNA